jgi:hypothetical protein
MVVVGDRFLELAAGDARVRRAARTSSYSGSTSPSGEDLETASEIAVPR